MAEAIPFYCLYNDDEFKTAITGLSLDVDFDYSSLSNKIFCPFEINEEMNLPLNDIDPDYQYYSDTNYASNINCEYHTEESFNRYMSAPNSIKNISLYHHNIRGLPGNFVKMDVMLNGLKTQFDIIGLSETWLKESNCDLYNIKNYAAYHKICKHKDRGGIALYIKNGIEYTERPDLEIDCCIAETIFIEINHSTFHTKKNILIGLFF